ncbi:hypothetical protein JCM10908_006917 [Rhodotorula pacifica]|uniref:uncharacterized protein n=1 Tax=Rhodotorula pacifica TaxID=1495444 RepID=UPI003175D95F
MSAGGGGGAAGGGGGGNIKVVVRCRPLNQREIARGAKCLVRMEGDHTYLDPPEMANVTSGRATEKETKSFAFDKSYWSACPKDDPSYASQQTLFDDLGRDLLEHAFEGYNTTVFAYGQTGSGKSYSMMGYGSDRGIIPLICEALFERIENRTHESGGQVSFTVEVSYTEIYQEKVRDLLNPSNKGSLKVREHPTLGPYVENLSKCAVQNFVDIERLMDEGTKARTVAATNMNETSSRSHAVFTLLLTQKRLDSTTNMVGEKVSRISLVDLAGSERANSTGATGTRLKEGALINKSLTTLGRVIAALAQASSAPTGKAAKAAAEKVPYRDSVLTWLLKDSLGGNSKTAMIAAISPADYEETLSTLRYADQAKKIKNKAVVNEDPNAKLIRELKEELETLRARMAGPASLGSPSIGANGFHALESTFDDSVPPERQMVQYKTASGEIKTISKAELQDQLEASEKLMASVTETWEQKLEKTKEVQLEREKALENLGITIEKGLLGVHTPKKMPHLVNLNEDPLMSECLIYQIKTGRTTVGNMDSDQPADIKLSGPNIHDDHCFFDCDDEGRVMLHAGAKGTTMVNGQRLSPDSAKELRSGFRVILGDFQVFRFNHPEEVRRARQTKSRQELRSPLADLVDESATSSPGGTRPESPFELGDTVDWSYARREAVVARLNGRDVNLDQLNDSDLNQLYSNILRVRHSRTSSSMAGSDRPESRMSFLDSVTEDGNDDEEEEAADTSRRSSRIRPRSTATWATDPTSLAESTLTLHNLPDLEEKGFAFDDVPTRSVFTPPSVSSSSAAADEETLREKRAMEEKVKKLETQMAVQRRRLARLKSTASNGAGSPASESDAWLDEWPSLTPAEEPIARRVAQVWKRQRRVRMAEDALSQAVLLKEANVMSRELKKGVTFQFAVVERPPPVSACESVTGIDDIDEAQDHALHACVKPCIAVKVLDRRHQVISIWSLPKLKQRVQQMREQYRWLDKPEYQQHLISQDPFCDSPPPPGGFSHVGTGLVSLLPLARRLASVQVIQLFSLYIADPIGTCRVRLQPVEASRSTMARRSSLPDDASDVLLVDLIIDEVCGFVKSEFASVQLQTTLADLIEVNDISADFAISSAIDLDHAPSTELKLEHRFCIPVTSTVEESLRNYLGAVYVFARPRLPHFDKIDRWDEAREGPRVDSTGVRGDPSHTDVTRRPETELISSQQHDVIAHIEIRELGEKGDYDPVQVVSVNRLDAGAFFLRQGLQRRLVIDLSHNSGRELAWKRVSKVALGNVRLLDQRGLVHAATSTSDVELRGIGTPRPEYPKDGMSLLSFAAAWDSSAHDSPHLNRPTPSGARALVQLSFEVEVAGCVAPIPFSVDLALTIAGRDARAPSRFTTLFSSNRLASRVAAVFCVTVQPYKTRKAADIWRLDTSETYVRGEEILSGWRPRGLSLIRDYDATSSATRKLADLEATKAILATIPDLSSGLTDRDEQTLLMHAISLWQKRFGTPAEITLERCAAPQTDKTASQNATPEPALRRPVQKTGSAALVPRTETANKRGILAMLRDPTSSEWRKHWFVLRRPYLYIYNSAAELDEAAVINVSTVRVEQTPEIEQMLERKFAFAIFTQQNSYFFAAPSFREMTEWTRAIDPSLAIERT